MTVGIFLIAAVALIGAYIVLDRKDARAAAERDRDRDERQTLLQRIQAPETAIIDHSAGYVTPDDDGRPLSDQEMAEMDVESRALAFLSQFSDVEGNNE